MWLYQEYDSFDILKVCILFSNRSNLSSRKLPPTSSPTKGTNKSKAATYRSKISLNYSKDEKYWAIV